MPSRRQFLHGTTAAAASMAVAQNASGQSQSDDQPNRPEIPTMPQVRLGRTEAQVSRMGIGCAPFQRTRVSVDDIKRTLDRALKLGINYLDVAPNYGNAAIGFSEVKMGPAIREIRDEVFLVTKTEEPTYEGTWRLLNQSLERLQTDTIDLIHIHNLGFENRFEDLDFVFSDRGALGALLEAKEQGIIRFIGASGHIYPSRFHYAIDSGQIDVIMNAVNFICQHTYDFENKVWARAKLEDIGLVAMKVLGGQGGRDGGFRVPEEMYEKAIRYALSIPGLCVAVIGIENIEQLERAAQVIAKAEPLTDRERHEIATEGLRLAQTDRWKLAYGSPLT